jgi:hypothetical protein
MASWFMVNDLKIVVATTTMSVSRFATVSQNDWGNAPETEVYDRVPIVNPSKQVCEFIMFML